MDLPRLFESITVAIKIIDFVSIPQTSLRYYSRGRAKIAYDDRLVFRGNVISTLQQNRDVKG